MEGYCRECLEKQREIDRLREENVRLRQRLRYQERIAREEGPFGSSTPSSKIPLKANTELSLEDRQARRGGAKPGHVGHGRSTAKESEADEVVTLEVAERTCPHCGVELEERRFEPRTVIDIPPPRTRTILYRRGARRCPRCRRHFRRVVVFCVAISPEIAGTWIEESQAAGQWRRPSFRGAVSQSMISSR